MVTESELIIGIDLGTTNSEVAIVDAGHPRIIPVDEAQLLPSVVGLDQTGELLIGTPAHNQYALYPERTVRSIKRSMGQDIEIVLDDQRFRPQEISALILRRLKQTAETELGSPVGKAVITVPAYFSDAQRQATKDAGELAGLEVVRIINEPTAAALAYEGESQQRRQILVYDLGGGTFDVSVVRMEQGVTEVLGSHGNNHLGGDDFDNKIIEHLVMHLQTTHGVDPSGNRQAMARIGRAAESAKITLSNAPYVTIEEEYLLEDKQGTPIHLSLELARHDYEAMIEPYIEETLEAVHIALDGAGLNVADLDEVLLVGGTTRTPLIQQRLEEILSLQPRSEIDPDLCVATGAAVQAAVIAGQQVGRVLVDITPYTFGTSALADFQGELYPYTFIPMIRKNSSIPVAKSDVFGTVMPGQQAVQIDVYQGEDPDALNNTEIGSFIVSGLNPKAPAGNQVLCNFSLDINGILQVTATEKETGLSKQITIENATGRLSEDQLSDARQRLDSMTGGSSVAPQEGAAASPAGSDQQQIKRAEELLGKAERLLETVASADRDDLIELMEAVREALNAADAGDLAARVEELAELIYFLES